MPELEEHVAYLSQQIGPRPAGTEEEQQAALYITEQMQKDAGLSAVIEDFASASDEDLPRAVCCAVTFVATIISMIISVFAIPAVILSIISAALFAAEVFDRPILSKFFARGVSQNVVAKYEPGYTAETGGSRRRKIVLVTHYDSGKTRAELKTPILSALPIILWASFGAMVFIPVFLLIRTVFFPYAEGAAAVFFTVLTVIALILVALPIVTTILHKVASYNEGANCNASGTAVLLEVARRIGRGRVSEAELAERNEAAIHGEEAARAAGVVPEGAELSYEASLVPPEPAPQTPEARLVAAKAAIAALSGKPVSGLSASDIAQNLVQVKEPPLPTPTDEDFRELRDETREAFTTIPAETMQEALANAEAARKEASQEAASGESFVAGAPVDVATPSLAAAADVIAMPAPAPAQSEPQDSSVPAWFKAAQEKAKKPRQDNKPVQRSRYASALDAAVSESAGHFAEASNLLEKETEQLESQRGEIREIKAPQWGVSTAQAEPVQPTEDIEPAVALVPRQTQPVPVVPQAAPYAVQATISADAVAPEAAQPVEAEAAASAAAPVAEDPFSTRAMAPIDINELNLDDVPAMNDVPMPSFLDPLKAQQEARAAKADDAPRTANRVDVTAAEIGGSGRIELQPQPASDVSTQPAASADEAAQPAAQTPAHRPIVLPDLGMTGSGLKPITELTKQRAPLAEAQTSGGKTAAKSLLTMLPSISLDAASQDAEATSGAAQPAAKRALRSMLPSLSGAIASKDAGAAPESAETAAAPAPAPAAVSTAGAFVPAGATGTFAQIGDELIENVDPDDIYIDDADDSAYDENFTETGAFAGPGYVEMPKSRIRRLFDKFHRKGKEEEPSPQEWLDVDDSFDARTVGAQRGGWESFRPEDADAVAPEAANSVQSAVPANAAPQAAMFAPLPGEMGAYGNQAGADDDLYYDDAFDEGDIDDYGDGYDDEFPPVNGRWQGGAFSRIRMGHVETKSGAEESVEAPQEALPAEPDMPSEIKQIYQFRNPDINTEVWLVALGSELAGHGGMNAFLTEHQQDLRGAIIIDINALGAGTLSMIECEGTYRKAKTSSRMKRYIKKASQATGLSVSNASIEWNDSAASVAIKQGFQAMHLVGMDGAKPAFFGDADDVMENVDEKTLRENTDFIMELLKNI